jgi:hypothetical protein
MLLGVRRRCVVVRRAVVTDPPVGPPHGDIAASMGERCSTHRGPVTESIWFWWVLACRGSSLHGGGCWLGVLLWRGLYSLLVGFGSGMEVVVVVLGGALLLLFIYGAL